MPTTAALAPALFLLFTASCLAQEADSLRLAEDAAEAALDGFDAEAEDPSALVELLAELTDHPLDVNTASAEELSRIPGLSAGLALGITGERERNGPFSHLRELLRVDGLSEDLFVRMAPYLTAVPPARAVRTYPAPPSFGDLAAGLRYDLIQRWTRRLDVGRGYERGAEEASPYLGSPARLYTRWRARYGKQFSLNLTLEKDPGELLRWAPRTRQYGFDHASAHLAFRDFGRIKTLIVGDYTAAFGQGVAMWDGPAPGKGRNAVSPVMRIGRGFVPFGSTEENRFFRGAAVTINLAPSLTVSAFASRRRLDASPSSADSTTTGVGALSTSGLHRTPHEVEGRDALGATAAGGGLEFRGNRSSLGLAGYRSWFARPLLPDHRPYRRYAFSGREAGMLSAYGHLLWRALTFFGEAAFSTNGSAGATGGLAYRGSRRAEIVVQARRYPRRLDGLYGQVFAARGGLPRNEAGIYTGLSLRLDDAWSVTGYFDLYQAPWLRFAVPRPSRGRDALLAVEYQPRTWLSVYAQARSQTQEQGTTAAGGRSHLLEALTDETRQSLRLHGSYVFGSELRVRARLETTRFFVAGRPPEHGFLLYNDIRWAPARWFQADARLAFFDTESFEARVFAYEDDLLYTFSVPAFSGRGRRIYFLVKWTRLASLTLQMKFAVTRYEDVTSLGSGLDTTEGNRIREVRFQLKWVM